ncbi:peptidoglycan DD-metalloendopeptidase family protein [Streptomyces sp. NPDC096030]|uniref:peptidoglycan DD-metalloendopeptidase family protein n=1 Tax=Streptomyces sp. NPDC096030 TaxID=3155423 RepID=UPI00332874A6
MHTPNRALPESRKKVTFMRKHGGCSGQGHGSPRARRLLPAAVLAAVAGGLLAPGAAHAATGDTAEPTQSVSAPDSVSGTDSGLVQTADVTLHSDSGYLTTLPAAQRGYLAFHQDETPQEADRFTLVELKDGEMALKSKLNGKYVMVDQSTTGFAGPNYHLRAASDSVGPWEKFTLHTTSDGSALLRSSSTGLYVQNSAGTLLGTGTESQAVRFGIPDWDTRYRHPLDGPGRQQWTPSYGEPLGAWAPGETATGVQWAVPYTAPVHAVSSGTVVSFGWESDILGYTLVIQHPDGTYSVYGRMAGPDVSVGQKVSAGTPLGLSGTTGLGYHPESRSVHFEIRSTPEPGSDIDPVAYMRENGVTL